MISTYADLVSAVQGALARSDVPENVYSLAVQDLNTQLRLRLMETETTLSATAGTETVALPSDYLQMRALWISATPPIVLDVQDAWNGMAGEDGASGQRAAYSIVGSNIRLHPTPDADYTLGIRYVSSVDEFSADADTNNVLTTHSGLFLYCALKHAAVWAQDADLAAIYSATYEADLRKVRKADRSARYPGPLRVRGAVA